MYKPIPLQNKAKGVIQLFRPELPFAAGLCVVIGELLALGRFPALPVVGLGFVCGFCLSGWRLSRTITLTLRSMGSTRHSDPCPLDC